jgi:hypothetical protein
VRQEEGLPRQGVLLHAVAQSVLEAHGHGLLIRIEQRDLQRVEPTQRPVHWRVGGPVDLLRLQVTLLA